MKKGLEDKVDKVSLSSRVQSFEEVNRELTKVNDTLNALLEKTTQTSEVDTTEGTEGNPGDIKTILNSDKTYSFSIRTEDGWKTPFLENREIIFKSKNPSAGEIKKSIDEIESKSTNEAKKTIFDEKADKFILPRPDYDSGWVALTHNSSVVLTHNLGLTEHPRLTQHYKSTSATPELGTHNIYDGAYTWDNSGCMIVFTGANTIKVWSDNSAMGGSGAAFSHDSAPTEDGSRKITTSGHIRVMLWK